MRLERSRSIVLEKVNFVFCSTCIPFETQKERAKGRMILSANTFRMNQRVEMQTVDLQQERNHFLGRETQKYDSQSVISFVHGVMMK